MARPLAWADTTLEITMIQAVNITPINLLLNLAPSDTVTTMRIVGHLYVIPASMSVQTSGQYRCDLGIGVTSVEAFNAGVVPDPQTDSERPARGWMWKDRLYSMKDRLDANNAYAVAGEVRFDVRSGRKVDRGICYLNAFQSQISGVAQNLILVGLIRVLCAT